MSRVAVARTYAEALLDLASRDDAGADYLGFVLYPPPPRGITASALGGILKELDRPCRPVAVVVNMPRAELLQVIHDCNLAAVQLHGDE